MRQISKSDNHLWDSIAASLPMMSDAIVHDIVPKQQIGLQLLPYISLRLMARVLMEDITVLTLKHQVIYD